MVPDQHSHWLKSQPSSELYISLPVFHIKPTHPSSHAYFNSSIQFYLMLNFHQWHKTQSQTYINSMVINTLENVQILVDFWLKTPRRWRRQMQIFRNRIQLKTRRCTHPYKFSRSHLAETQNSKAQFVFTLCTGIPSEWALGKHCTIHSLPVMPHCPLQCEINDSEFIHSPFLTPEVWNWLGKDNK